MSEEEELQRQISAVIIQLRLHSPFFATLALFAKILPSRTIPTAATDGRDIFINLKFWRSLNSQERLGLLTHEILHAALLHVPRRGQRDPLLWNVAADVVVNGIVLAEEGFVLPKGHLRDKQMELWSVEEVYERIQANPKLSKLLKLLFSDLLAEASPGHKAELEQHWRQALHQANIVSDIAGQGHLPAGLQRELTQLSPSQIDWRTYLWRFLVQTPVDFQGFDRRFIGQGLYLETLAGEKVSVLIAVDTSGSIASAQMGLFLGEVAAILGAYPHIEAKLYYADAACYGPYELEKQEELPRPVGGGGTDFRPFFRIVEEDMNATLCIYLTDGYGIFPSRPPKAPVLWVITPGGLNPEQIPFGESTRLLSF